MDQPSDIWANYSPLQVHVPFHLSDATIRLLAGSLGSGKSQAACEEIIRIAASESGQLIGIFRKYRKALLTSTMETFWRCVPPHVADKERSYNKSDDMITINCIDGKTSRIFISDLSEEFKYRSKEFSCILIDELNEIKSKEIFSGLTARVRQAPFTPKIIAVTNTDIPKNHWIYKHFVDSPPDDTQTFMSNVYDNPHLPKGYIKRLKDGYTKDQQKAYVLGEWSVATSSRSVYAQFRSELHKRKIKYNPQKDIYVSMDFGWNTAVAGFYQISDHGHICLIHVHYAYQKSLDTFLDEIISLLSHTFPTQQKVHYTGDPAISQHSHLSDKSGLEICEEKGVYMVTHKQTIKEGITLVQKKLEKLIEGTPAIIFNSLLEPRVFEDLLSYQYEERLRPGQSDYIPIHDDTSHFNDQLRYLVFHLNSQATRQKSEEHEIAAYLLQDKQQSSFL